MTPVCSRTHLGHLLKPDDLVLGTVLLCSTFCHFQIRYCFDVFEKKLLAQKYSFFFVFEISSEFGMEILGFDLQNSNGNNAILDGMDASKIPDVVVVKKIFDRTARQRRRMSKLKRLVVGGEIIADSASVENDFHDSVQLFSERYFFFVSQKEKHNTDNSE